jgi:hypothetical protein
MAISTKVSRSDIAGWASKLAQAISKFRATVVRGVLPTLAATYTCSVHAVQTPCPFSVLGQQLPVATTDGVILSRYAQGVRGSSLLPGLSNSQISQIETSITANERRFDLDGDLAFTRNDALLIARHVTGFKQGGLTSGITFSGNAVDKTPDAIEAYISAGCPLREVAAPDQPTHFIGTYDNVEGSSFDLVVTGPRAASVEAVSIAGNSCKQTLDIQANTAKRFVCVTPQASTTAQSSFYIDLQYADTSLTGTLTGTRGPYYTSSANYWQSVNGAMFVNTLGSYVVHSYSDRGPRIALHPRSLSGEYADIAFPQYYGWLRLYGGSGQYECVASSSNNWTYQCPKLPTGVYSFQVLFENKTRYLAGSYHIVSVTAVELPAPPDAPVSLPINPPGSPCDLRVMKACP